jgi:hypothetical protein
VSRLFPLKIAGRLEEAFRALKPPDSPAARFFQRRNADIEFRVSAACWKESVAGRGRLRTGGRTWLHIIFPMGSQFMVTPRSLIPSAAPVPGFYFPQYIESVLFRRQDDGESPLPSSKYENQIMQRYLYRSSDNMSALEVVWGKRSTPIRRSYRRQRRHTMHCMQGRRTAVAPTPEENQSVSMPGALGIPECFHVVPEEHADRGRGSETQFSDQIK